MNPSDQEKQPKKNFRVTLLILSIVIIGLIGLCALPATRSRIKSIVGKNEVSQNEATQIANSATQDSETASEAIDQTEEATETSTTEEPSSVAEETESAAPTKKKKSKKLIIKKQPDTYLYTDMVKDIKVLKQKYPKLLDVYSIAQTIDNRDVWVFRIGSEDATHKILINAGIHAREYITCQMLMELTCDFLKAYSEGASYKDYSIQGLMQETAIYVIPMLNPDGMTISQLGLDGVQTDLVKKHLKDIAAADGNSLSDSTYLKRWKANANGIDLNRNFDALWDSYAGSGHISSDHYKGSSIGCEAESGSLIELTQKEHFDRTISYHTQGEVIYWYFAQQDPLYTASSNFANRMSKTTGYKLDANYQDLDPAGYKDWCLYRMDIPSLTIEVGRETSPVPQKQYSTIYKENANVFYETIIDMIENPYTPSENPSAPTEPLLMEELSPDEDTEKGYIEYIDSNTLFVSNCNEYITLRQGPDTGQKEITKLPLGEQVEFIDTAKNGFYKVKYRGQTGYALAKYLSPDEPYLILYEVAYCKEYITLRKQPNTKASELDKVYLGELVTYLTDADNGFIKVAYNGQIGYVLKEYTKR